MNCELFKCWKISQHQTHTHKKKQEKSGNGEDNAVFTLWDNSSPPGWRVSMKRGRRGKEGEGKWLAGDGLGVGGGEAGVGRGVGERITLPNPLWRPQLGALSAAAGANT